MATPLNPKIQDLVARLNRDPDSKIFLQLAEEYRKEGLLEEALLVCKSGLKKHPGYQSARVAMGRIFFSLRRLEEARAEFESVLRASPDNLLANRLLGDLLLQMGDTNGAIERYRAVQMYGPSDPDIAVKLQTLEAKRTPSAARYVAAGKVPTQPAAAVPSAKEAPVPAAAKPAAKDSPPGPTETAKQKGPELAPPPAPAAKEAAAPVAAKPAAKDSPPGPTITAKQRAPAFTPPPAPAAKEASAPAAAVPSAKEEPAPAAPVPVAGGKPSPPPAAVASDKPAVEGSAGGLKKPRDGINTQTLAELYVRQGFVDRALDMYRRLLDQDPDNHEIQRRLRELDPRVGERQQQPVAAAPAAQRARNSDVAGAPERARKIERLERWLKTIQAGRP